MGGFGGTCSVFRLNGHRSRLCKTYALSNWIEDLMNFDGGRIGNIQKAAGCERIEISGKMGSDSNPETSLGKFYLSCS